MASGYPDLRGRVGGLIARGAPPDKIAEAQRCLKYAKGSAILRELVESAPPFTAEQTLNLTRILTSPAGGGDAA